MSIYSETSQKIGWQRQPRRPISSIEAKQLLEEVTNGSVESFEKVFTLHRFMRIDELTEDQQSALHIIEAAFRVGREQFQ